MLGSENTGLGSIPTAAEVEEGPPGPPGPPGTAPASAVVGLTFPTPGGVPTLTAGSPVQFPGEVAAEGKLFADDGLQVTGDELVTGNSQVDGTQDFLGPVHAHTGAPVQIDDDLISNTSTSLNGTTGIDGALNINGTATFIGVATLNGDDVAVVPGNTVAAAVATWAIATKRFFAVDGVNGIDTNTGFSDVSQAAAGVVALKTIARLLEVLPIVGNGRNAQVAVKAGAYATDTILAIPHAGYASLLIYVTDTVASAGAIAFQGDAADKTALGMTTATGMNAAGYNPIAGSTANSLVAQLAGGGAPGFGAVPARPYGCRIRFDVASTTAALRNFGTTVLLTTGGTTLAIADLLPAAPVSSDVFYIEMPNLTGPTLTYLQGSGDVTSTLATIAGFNLGAVEATKAAFQLAGCETGAILTFGCFVQILGQYSSSGTIHSGGVRATQINSEGDYLTVNDLATTSTTAFNAYINPVFLLYERSSCSGMLVYGGFNANGNNVASGIGTNSSTVHGNDCQSWGQPTPPPGVQACGLSVGGGTTLGRTHFTGMGVRPCARINGTGLGVNVYGITGSIADGNLDVGLDLSPSGLSGNTTGAMGCTISIVGTPSATGTNGDIRLSDGTIISWATAMAGVVDANGNRIFAAGNAPDHPIAVASGAGVLAPTNAPAGATTYARYFKIPDGAGGFFTVGSLT
jgi:hypothetical protein